MNSIRLKPDIIKKLRKSKGLGAAIIKTAVERYEKGEIVIQNVDSDEKQQNVLLEVFPIRSKPTGYSDSQLRSIIDSHFAHPINVDHEIAQLDRDISAMITKEKQSSFLIVEEL